MKDTLGDRMKDYYEDRTRIFLPRRTYTIIRIDGKAFHTYTRGLIRPFDMPFIKDMDETACFLCQNIQGAKLAFVQSDEISILLTDFDKLQTDAWFDGNIQKMTSISASMTTAKFNTLRKQRFQDFNFKDAYFDSRIFTIPNITEVKNYLIWRQQDTVRNSISSLAQSLYSSKELHGKNSNVMQEMCFQKGVNWDKLNPKLKRGRLIVKKTYDKEGTVRTKWVSTAPPTFTTETKVLDELIPKYE